MDYTPFLITFKLAFLTAIILLLICLPLAYLFAFKKWKGKVILESLLMLPIVLPPTVLGFYFLTFFGKNSAFGGFLYSNLNIELAFTFPGILLGTLIFCTPFMISPIIAGFREIPKNIIEATLILKKSRWSALIKVYIPYIKRALLSAILLTFAHTVGAFGIVLMIGGKIQGTKVASVAIYDEMNKPDHGYANTYALALLLISFILILLLNIIVKKKKSIA
jgi:molybdate transport system permease protein